MALSENGFHCWLRSVFIVRDNGILQFAEEPISGNNVTVLLDSIEFSATEIPEPTPVGIVSLGALVFGCRLRRRLVAPLHTSAFGRKERTSQPAHGRLAEVGNPS
jgi:hypothetical protein